MNRKNVKKMIFAVAAISILAVGSIAAYFTDGDTATNTFTVGKISLDLQEPSWEPPTDITPGQDIPKDPQILNDGVNDEYVFIKVIVPCANVVTANEDGTKNAVADTELYSWNVNNGWVQVGNVIKDETKHTHTYVYAYGTNSAMTPLAKNATTPKLFNYVRFADVVEDQALESKSLDIVLEAYGIQTTNINDNADINGNNADGKTAPVDVWAVLSTQAPSTDVGVAEAANTDIKQK